MLKIKKTQLLKRITIPILSFILLISCSKNGTTTSASIVGTWILTNQTVNRSAYPSGQRDLSSYLWSLTADSVNITFDNSGNYTFNNFHLPVDNGKYTIYKDSFLIIKPSTADFIKFNYSLPQFANNPTPILNYTPYVNFNFSTDTILLQKSTNNIVFSGVWVTKAGGVIIPTNDTLILNRSLSYFRRK